MNIVDNYSSKAGKQLKAALVLASLSKCNHRHGAIIVKNGVVIAAASNQQRQAQQPHWSDNSWRRLSIHAEEAAISMAGNFAKGATLYVGRVGNSGKTINSRPCQRCVGLAERSGIKKIVHT